MFEKAVDDGGPRKEFFRFALLACSQSDFFVGPPTCKVVAQNVASIQQSKYLVAGTCTRDCFLSAVVLVG